MGNALQDFDKPRSSLEYYEKAIRLKSNFPQAYLSLGATLEILGKKEDALNEHSHDASFDNISMENANYLQNTQENNLESTSDIKDELPNFEVESIELATPELFENEFNTEINQDDLNHTSPSVFDKATNGKSTEIVKEPEMFDEPGLEENFEIPAFLRKQKF